VYGERDRQHAGICGAGGRGPQEAPKPSSKLREVRPIDELEDEKRAPVLLPYSEERNDVGVPNGREEPRLSPERSRNTGTERAKEALDAHRARHLEAVVARLVDRSRAPPADLLEQDEPPLVKRDRGKGAGY
jgi:hypothetical protein